MIVEIESVLYIGQVMSVEGRLIKIAVEKNKNLSHLLFKGKVLKSVSVGNYIKIKKGYLNLIGKIESEYISEDRLGLKQDYTRQGNSVQRILSLSLVGFYEQGKFKRGVSELPLISNECFLLEENEFNSIHSFIKEGDEPLVIGKLASEKSIDISIGVNGLFASHIGIFGNTGSGKSYTLAKIYNELLGKYAKYDKFKENSKFVLIDFNGEYVDIQNAKNDNVITDYCNKNICVLSTSGKGADKLPIGPESLNDSVIWSIILEATEKTQSPFLKKALKNKKLNELIDSTENSLVEYLEEIILKATLNEYKKIDPSLPSNILYEINAVCGQNQSGELKILDIVSKFDDCLLYNSTTSAFYWQEPGEKPIYFDKPGFKDKITEFLQKIKIDVKSFSALNKVRLKILLFYFGGIVRGFINQEHIAPLIGRLEGKFNDLNKVLDFEKSLDSNRNFTVVSLRDVNIQMRKIIPLLLCKSLYEKKKSNLDKSKYLNLIIDEAHNILSSSSIRESEHWKDYRLETFEEIIKEGRKFGVFLTIASQRPSDISPTIISQLHNYILHRLVNSNDIYAIEKTVSYLDRVSFESLSILPTGTCVLAGMVAEIPVTVEISEIDEKYKPFNQTIAPLKFWK
jgi:DNA helicase HerA-like ATPase